MDTATLFRSARRDPSVAVLEGFHPLKHALRFGAEIVAAVGTDPAAVRELAETLAPDLVERLDSLIEPVSGEVFAQLMPDPPASGVAALARRPLVDHTVVLADPAPGPVVLLDHPRHLGNVGAVVRVAAAAGAAAVVATGDRDPWHPAALRGSAGLHFALPVIHLQSPDRGGRPLVALDPNGEPLGPTSIPDRAMLAFGSERRGLSPELLEAASLRLAIPMRPGVSSLNLATAVAVTLYCAAPRA